MKNLLIIIMLSPVLLMGQSMTWVPSQYVNSGCEDLSDCKANIVCYNLQYTPARSGTLTSYTSAFFADCTDGGTKVLVNRSCSMVDNSFEIEACDEHNKVMISCSANSGSIKLKKFKTKVLHQVCFELAYREDIVINKEPVVGITTSLNLNDGNFQSESPKYLPFKVENDVERCEYDETDIKLGATTHDGYGKVSWTPAGETGLGQYEIYRTAEDGSRGLVATIADQNYSEDDFMYSYEDQLPDFGTYAYTVEYVSDLGRQLSNSVSIEYRSDAFSFDLFPNPGVAREHVYVKVTGVEETYDVHIADSRGQHLRTFTVNANDETKIDFNFAKAGIYLMTVKDQNTPVTKKLVLIQ